MKQRNMLKSAGVVLFSVFALATSAQTDTTRKDTSGRDTTSMAQDHQHMGMGQQYTITDLENNMVIDIYYDTMNYRAVNRTTGEPVEFYVINRTDTVHGPTGLIVNGMLMQDDEGNYELDESVVKVEDDEFMIKMAEGRKVKWEDGQLKIKEWGKKGEAQAGKEKMRNQWSKVRWKEDEWRVETVTG
jgi:hypothetical protein